MSSALASLTIPALTLTLYVDSECTLVWAVAMGVIMWFFSNLRDFKVGGKLSDQRVASFGADESLPYDASTQHMAYIGVLASSTMFICVWIVIIGHGVQGQF